MSSSDELILQEWEIWHQYTTYVLDHPIDTQLAAASLTCDGIARCARVFGGKFHWAEGGETREASPIISIGRNGMGELDLRTVPRMDPYALEGLYQSSWFEASEAKLLTSDILAPASYTRAFMGICRLVDQEGSFDLYPLIKVYSTGILQVTFRMMCPSGGGIPIHEFIHTYRDLARREFDHVLIPASLLENHAKHYLTSSRGTVSRGLRRKAWGSLPQYIAQHSESIDTGEFQFEVAPLFCRGLRVGLSDAGQLTMLPAQGSEPSYVLEELAEVILSATSRALARSRWMNRAGHENRLGDFRLGKPHIYITAHSNQKWRASKNEEVHREEFGEIISGVICDSAQQAASFLPASSRSFDDFGWYVTQAALLQVWARYGLERWSRGAPNRADLIYEQHAVAEALDYGYLLHCRALELASRTATSKQAYAAHEDLIHLRQRLNSPSRYGEIEDLLQSGWSAAGVDKLYGMVGEMLTLRRQQTTERESERATRWSHLVSTALGVLATLGIADQVVSPIWNWLNLPKLSVPAQQSLVQVGVSFGIVLGLLGILRCVSESCRRHT